MTTNVTAPVVPQAVQDAASFLLEGFRVMFYLKTPSEMALDDTDDEPKFLLNYGVPMFFVFMAIEWVGLALRHHYGGHKNANSHGGERPAKIYRLNDMLVSTTLGTAQTIFVFLQDYLGLLGQAFLFNFVSQYKFMTVDVKEHPWISFAVLMLWRVRSCTTSACQSLCFALISATFRIAATTGTTDFCTSSTFFGRPTAFTTVVRVSMCSVR